MKERKEEEEDEDEGKSTHDENWSLGDVTWEKERGGGGGSSG